MCVWTGDLLLRWGKEAGLGGGREEGGGAGCGLGVVKRHVGGGGRGRVVDWAEVGGGGKGGMGRRVVGRGVGPPACLG